MQYLPHVTITRPRYMPSSASRVSMDHPQKAPECSYTFAALRTCMQNRKQADTAMKKGACTTKQALSYRNKGESSWLLMNRSIIARPFFFSRPLFLISLRGLPLRLPSLCVLCPRAYWEIGLGRHFHTIFAHVSHRTEIRLISDD